MDGIAASAFQAAFEQAVAPGSQALATEQLHRFLDLLQLQVTPQQLDSALQQLGGNQRSLTKDDM